MENGMFAQMLRPARQWLAGRDPREIALRAGVDFDVERSEFRFLSLGREVCVRWPGCEVVPELEGWHQLVILHYLHLADGMSLRGEWTSFASMKDGMIRGGGFDRQSALELERIFKDHSEEEICGTVRRMGGRMVESNADVCAVLPFLPGFPVMLKVWLADEEDDVGLSARLLVDGAADHYLTIEDAVTVGSIVLEALKAQVGC